MTMTALTIRPSFDLSATELAPLHRMGATLPAFVRTVGALAALLAAVALTGVVLVGFAVVLPFALVAALVARRTTPRGERTGWRPAAA